MDELTTGNENQIEEREIQPRDYHDPKAQVNILGSWYAKDEVEQVERQNARRQAAYKKKLHERWMETEQGKLCKAFYEAFQACRKYLEENAQAQKRPDGSALEFEEHKLFEQGLLMMDNHHEERTERDRAGEGG